MRAARGLLESKLTTPQAISEAPLEDEVEALHSEGNVQRGMKLQALILAVKVHCFAQQQPILSTYDEHIITHCTICCCLQPRA